MRRWLLLVVTSLWVSGCASAIESVDKNRTKHNYRWRTVFDHAEYDDPHDFSWNP